MSTQIYIYIHVHVRCTYANFYPLRTVHGKSLDDVSETECTWLPLAVHAITTCSHAVPSKNTFFVYVLVQCIIYCTCTRTCVASDCIAIFIMYYVLMYCTWWKKIPNAHLMKCLSHTLCWTLLYYAFLSTQILSVRAQAWSLCATAKGGEARYSWQWGKHKWVKLLESLLAVFTITHL